MFTNKGSTLLISMLALIAISAAWMAVSTIVPASLRSSLESHRQSESAGVLGSLRPAVIEHCNETLVGQRLTQAHLSGPFRVPNIDQYFYSHSRTELSGKIGIRAFVEINQAATFPLNQDVPTWGLVSYETFARQTNQTLGRDGVEILLKIRRTQIQPSPPQFEWVITGCSTDVSEQSCGSFGDALQVSNNQIQTINHGGQTNGTYAQQSNLRNIGCYADNLKALSQGCDHRVIGQALVMTTCSSIYSRIAAPQVPGEVSDFCDILKNQLSASNPCGGGGGGGGGMGTLNTSMLEPHLMRLIPWIEGKRK